MRIHFHLRRINWVELIILYINQSINLLINPNFYDLHMPIKSLAFLYVSSAFTPWFIIPNHNNNNILIVLN